MEKKVSKDSSSKGLWSMPGTMYNDAAAHGIRERINSLEQSLREQVRKLRSLDVQILTSDDLKKLTPDYIRKGIKESKAAQLYRSFQTKADDDFYVRTSDIQYSDGKTLYLPPKPVTLDADYIIIETLMGQQVAFRNYRAAIDVSFLPNGIYALRSLGRKGRNHRIGYFSIYRR